jgi:hypothetical protein
MAAADRAAAEAFECGPAVLSALFRVSRQTIAEWRRAGMPACGPARYRLAEVVAWRRQRDIEAAAARDGPLADERRRLIIEQRRGHELANARQAEALLPVEDVAADICAYQRILDNALDALVDDAAAALCGIDDPDDAHHRLRAVCRQTRVSLAAQFSAYGVGLSDDGDGADNGD